MQWDILDKQTRYQGFFDVCHVRIRHDCFSGANRMVIERELIQRGDAVAVLPYDPQQDTVVLIEQFRIGALQSSHGPWMIETIAGLVEPDEALAEVAHREALEEAGCTLLELLPIHHYYATPGSSSERIGVFMARVDSRQLQDQAIHGLAHEGEEIRVHILPVEQAFALLDSGRIESAMPIIALQWLRLNHDALRTRWHTP
ncbi:NUDIX domain-containing protein [Thiorhodospira sibirica]|uniref:NUDIX domain-containing protein n=1 Tax=Thiorhodospira sibirica TaxID=154347 RepID=UPI00022C5E54|nr:NUDIX domain-containing protein [Thiorhodospira sibirica]